MEKGINLRDKSKAVVGDRGISNDHDDSSASNRLLANLTRWNGYLGGRVEEQHPEASADGNYYCS